LYQCSRRSRTSIGSGRLVAAPYPRETLSGKHITTARVAVQPGADLDFFVVVLWGQMADFATRYVMKGRLVYVAGKLSSR
jgi:single-stranded DNA-binding protein